MRSRPTRSTPTLLVAVAVMAASLVVTPPAPALAASDGLHAPSSVTVGSSDPVGVTGISIAGLTTSLTVSLSTDVGTLSAGGETGTTIELSGAPDAVNASLAGLTYTPSGASFGTSITVTVIEADGFHHYDGHYYRLVDTLDTWPTHGTAALASEFLGRAGYLATINSAEENAFLSTLIGGPSAWIGATDAAVDGTWRWKWGPEADDVLSYTNFTPWNSVHGQGWLPDEPNNAEAADTAWMWGTTPAWDGAPNVTGTWNDAGLEDGSDNVEAHALYEYGSPDDANPAPLTAEIALAGGISAPSSVAIDATTVSVAGVSVNGFSTSVEVSASVSVGTLSASGTDVTIGGDGTGLLTISGDPGSVNAALATLAYTGDAGQVATELVVTVEEADGHHHHDGHYYRVEGTTDSWSDHLAAAAGTTFAGRTGYLATITSSGENAFVHGLGASDIWLAGSDAGAEGNWTWRAGPESGDTFGAYANWRGGEPNNSGGNEHSLAMWTSDGTWNDADGAISIGAVYEYGGLSGDTPGSMTATVSLTPTALACDATTFHVSNGEWFTFNGATASFVSSGVTSMKTADRQLNGIGFRTADGFVYGLLDRGAANHLIRVGSNGLYQDLGPVTGLDGQWYVVGDFDNTRDLLVIYNRTGQSATYVDVATASATGVGHATGNPPTGGDFSGDFAFLGSSTGVTSVAYGAVSGTTSTLLQSLDFSDPDAPSYSATEIDIPPGAGLAGSVYTDATGALYLYFNSTDEVWHLESPDDTTPTRILTQGSPTGNNDGAGCPTHGASAFGDVPLPTAVDDAATGTSNAPITVAAPGVLANDDDGPGDHALSASLVDSAAGLDSVVLAADGSFTATPTADFVGTTSFTYRVSDDRTPAQQSDPATVTLTFTGTPTVTTGSATDIDSTTATLTATANAAATTSTTQFCVSTSEDLSSPACQNATPDTIAGTTTTPFSTALNGLAPGTQYFYTALLDTAGNPTQGTTKTFTTPVGTATVTTGSATDITSTTATLTATGNAAGDELTAEICFAVSPSEDLTCVDGSPASVSGNAPSVFTVSLSGLAPGTTYRYRARLLSDDPDSVPVTGQMAEFVTPSPPPPIVTCLYNNDSFQTTTGGWTVPCWQPPAWSAPLDDVPDWQSEAASFVVVNGAMGHDDGSFRPNGEVSRVAAAESLRLLLGGTGDTDHPFTDLEPHPAVAWLHDLGVVQGTGAGAFDPERPLTRGQAIMVLWRLSGRPDATEPHGFDDVPGWLEEPVTWAREQGIVVGRTEDLLDPDTPITRGEWAVLLHRWATNL